MTQGHFHKLRCRFDKPRDQSEKLKIWNLRYFWSKRFKKRLTLSPGPISDFLRIGDSKDRETIRSSFQERQGEAGVNRQCRDISANGSKPSESGMSSDIFVFPIGLPQSLISAPWTSAPVLFAQTDLGWQIPGTRTHHRAISELVAGSTLHPEPSDYSFFLCASEIGNRRHLVPGMIILGQESKVT